MRSHKIITTVVGLLACFGVGYAISGLLTTGSCGDGSPACPEGVGLLVAPLAAGIAAGVIATIAGGGVMVFAGLVAAVGLGALLGARQAVRGDDWFPLVFGAVFLAAGMVPAVTAQLARRNMARATAVAERGRPAIGTIRAVRGTGATVDEDPLI